MQAQEEKFLQSLIDGVDLLVADGWLRVREKWEPGIVHGLGSAVGECMTKLRTALAQYNTAPPEQRDLVALRAAIARDFAAVMAQRSEAVKDLLAEMVTEVARESGEFLTINGLSGDPPSLETLSPDPEAEARRLGCAMTIDFHVSKAFIEFTPKIYAVIDATDKLESAASTLDQRLEDIANSWRMRLETTACTATHNAYNNATEAISDALGRA